MGIRFDEINYISTTGGGIRISLKASIWTFDLAGGLYANLFVDKGRKVRIYAGAGPLMNFASYRTESEYDDDVTPTETESESAFGVGVYARTGLEFRVHYRGTLGMGARGTWASVDFTEYGGSSDLVGIAGFVTYTAGF